MFDLGTIVTGIVSSAGTVIESLFDASETPAVLTAVAVLPIIGGIVGLVVRVTRKGRG